MDVDHELNMNEGGHDLFMNKYFLVMLTLLIIGLLIIFIFNKKNTYDNFRIINYQLNNENFRLLVADTEEKRNRGLMYYRKLDGVDGMIFIFSDKKIRNFWNKNTFLDLDVYWLDNEKVLGKSILLSVEKSNSIITINSPAPVDKVIELQVK